MVPTRCNTIKETIEHVRKHCQWMPIGRDHLSKRPFCSRNSNASDNGWISISVRPVVKINEAVGDRWAKNGPNQAGQGNADAGDAPDSLRAITHLSNR